MNRSRPGAPASRTSSMPRGRLAWALALTVFAAAPLAAQDKRPLEIADYHLWRTIEDASLSDDGRWVTWTYAKVRADDTLHVRSVDDAQRRHELPRASGGVFSPDGRWLAYTLEPGFLEVERLEREGDRVPRQAGLLDLASGNTVTWEDVSGFGFSPSSTHFWVKKRAGDPDRGGNDEEQGSGTDLILRDLRTAPGYDELIGSVDALAFDSAGTHLAYTVDNDGADGNGVYLVDLATGSRRVLDNTRDRYARLRWSDDGSALAVLRGSTPEGMVERVNTALVFRDVASSPRRIEIPADVNGLRDGWVLSEKGELVFDEEGRTVFVGLDVAWD